MIFINNFTEKEGISLKKDKNLSKPTGNTSFNTNANLKDPTKAFQFESFKIEGLKKSMLTDTDKIKWETIKDEAIEKAQNRIISSLQGSTLYVKRSKEKKILGKRDLSLQDIEKSLQNIEYIFYDLEPRKGGKGEELHLFSTAVIKDKKHQIAIDLIKEGAEHRIKSIVGLSEQYAKKIKNRSVLMYQLI